MAKTILVPSSNGYHQYISSDLLTLERTVSLKGEVNSESIFEIIEQLLYLDHQSDRPITLLICSPGGQVESGLALIDVMKTLRSPINTVAVGMAASMAGVIFACGSESRRYVLPSSTVMIHDPLVPSLGRTNLSQMISTSKDMEKTRNIINEILAERCHKNIREINKATKAETYLKGQEAVKFGIADQLLDSELTKGQDLLTAIH